MTSGELFLIDKSAEEPRPEPVDHVSFQSELKSAKLSGSFMVTFVRQQALEKFMAEVVDPLAELCRDLTEGRSEFLKSTELPWSSSAAPVSLTNGRSWEAPEMR